MAQEAGVQSGTNVQAGASRGPSEMLAPFIKYLEEAGLLDFRVVSDNANGEIDYVAMDNRIRMQALMMLANRFGLGSPYERDEYVFGPSSSVLTRDSQCLSEDRARLYDDVQPSVPDSFRRHEFERLVEGKDTRWLIAASKMTQLRAYRNTREDLMYTVRDDDLEGREPEYPKEYVSGVLDELERAGLVTAYQ